jgi:N,N-dimethylformamidase
LDRLDHDLGTPAHVLWLATSSGLHSDHYQLVHEDILWTAPGQGGAENPRVRADMVYFENAGGGGVFSVGSINWCGSLPYDDFDNNVSKITLNVLRHFLEAPG